MLKLTELSTIGRGAVTLRRLFLAGVAATGLYTVGDDGVSYLKTAGRMVSTEVADNIPVEFELERAKTMIGDLLPDIKRNMIVIAQEEVSVDNVRKEIEQSRATVTSQREDIMKLRVAMDGEDGIAKVGKRFATTEEISAELKRRFTRFRMSEATLDAKQDLLASRETSLEAARQKLERMLNAKRDLEVQVENLQARLRSVESEAVTSKVDFDESHVARCEKLVDGLRIRLQVAERLLTAEGSVEDLLPSTFVSVDEDDVVTEIDAYFAAKPSSGNLASMDR